MKSMKFHKDYFDSIDKRMRNRERIKKAMQLEYDNLPEAEKQRRKNRTMELVKEIEEMGCSSGNAYEMATQGY